jgi:hypothetical protein
VAASFLGRQRQGIHHAPIMRISCVRSPPGAVVTAPADRLAPAGRSRLAAAPLCCRTPAFPVGSWCVFVCFCVCLRWYVTVRAGEQTRTPAPHQSPGVGQDSGHDVPSRRPSDAVGSSPSPAAAEPSGFRVAHCQGAGRPTGRPVCEVVKPRPKPSSDLGRDLPTLRRSSDRFSGLSTTQRSLDHSWRDEGGIPGNPHGHPRPGGAAGTRTPDLRRARAALSQLSYGPDSSVPALPGLRRPAPGPHDRTGWARLDSNQGPRPYQGRALTA